MLQRAPVDPPPRTRRAASEPRRFPWDALVLFGVAFALRAGYATLALGPDARPSSDSATYDAVAWNLARGLGFSLDGAHGPYPTAFVPPAVPWLTSVLYSAAGHRFFAAILLQCVLGALLPLLVAGFARATFGGGVARWAGPIVAVHPLLVFFSGYVMTETAFCLALVTALFVSAEWVKTPRPGRAFGAGIAWGLAALVRPTALVLPLVVALWAWVPLGLTVRAGDRVRQLALLLAGVALALAPWTVRNLRVMHAFVPVTTGGGRSLLDANNPLVWDDPVRRGGATSVYGLEPWASRFRGRSEVEVDAISGEIAKAFLRERIAQWPAMAAAKLGRFWRLTSEGGGTGAWRRRGTPLDAVLGVLDPLLVWSLVTIPFAIAGLVITLRGPKRLFLALPMWIVLALSLGAVVYWGSLRLRVPAEPLVALYVAVGADALHRHWRFRRRGLALVPRSD